MSSTEILLRGIAIGVVIAWAIYRWVSVPPQRLSREDFGAAWYHGTRTPEPSERCPEGPEIGPTQSR